MPLKNFFICRSGRDGPLLSSEKKVDKDSRGALPLRTPFQRPAANLPFSLAAGRLKRPFGRKPPADRETLEKPRSRAQLFGRFCALGMRRGFCPAGFLPAAGNRRWDFSLPGKIEAQRGRAPGTSRGRARLKCRHKHGARLARRSRANCSPQVCPPQARAFSPPGKTGAVRGRAPGTSRGRARRGEEKDTVRELLGAAAQVFFGKNG